MFRWIRRLRRARCRQPVRVRGHYRPTFEGLEDRSLLAAPVLDALQNITIPIGKTRIIPLTAVDADGDRLSYTVTSNNTNAAIVDVHDGNPFLRLEVSYTPQGASSPVTGVMEFQLFRDLAPNTVNQIRALVENGFYTNKTFHRLAFNGTSPFVIQGGAPNPDGSGQALPQPFDDEYNITAIFTGDGQLAMAKSLDDTNDSQFFVTFGPQRHLDFNHSIFGQLLRGFAVRDAIINVPRDANDRPTNPVTIISATIVDNRTDNTVTLRANAAAEATITVTVSDGTGGTDTKTFAVTGFTDTTNTPPFLGPVANQAVTAGQTLDFQLLGEDLEGNPIEFRVDQVGATDATRASVVVSNGLVMITPPATFSGVLTFTGSARPEGAASASDSQRFTVTVTPAPPVPKPIVDPSLTGNRFFVAQTYLEILDRQVDATGLGSWSAFLDQGVSRPTVVRLIQNSPEFRTNAVTELYVTLLGRQPDTRALQTALRYLQEGGNYDHIRRVILGSQEYFERQANSDGMSFLENAYQDILNRAIDTSGRTTYSQMLLDGFSRQEVVQALMSSEEGRRRRADQIYQEVLGRNADEVGGAEMVRQMAAGVPEDLLIANTVNTEEGRLLVTQ